ncbi:hypothetical protein IT575_11775 [bacterium]|nr:hypothetical protein [bacterium]
MRGKWIAIAAVSSLAAIGLGVAAYAAAGGQESAAGEKWQGRRGKVLYGELTQAGATSWTIKPELPPKLKERLESRAAEKGIELPALPDSVTVQLGSDSRFWLNGEAAAAGDFKAGEDVVVRLDKSWKESGASVLGAADPQSARNYVLAKMGHGDGQGGGRGAKHGKGERGGPGGHRGPRIAFGEVTAVSADSITIKPELPDFVKQIHEERQKERQERQEARGGEGGKGKGPKEPRELPDSLTFKLSDMTVFVVNEGEKDSNPFKVGDKVGILPAPPPGGPRGGREGGHGRKGHGGPESEDGPDMQGPPPGGPEAEGAAPREIEAMVVSDYASAEARMKERREKRGQKRDGQKRDGQAENGGKGEGNN